MTITKYAETRNRKKNTVMQQCNRLQIGSMKYGEKFLTDEEVAKLDEYGKSKDPMTIAKYAKLRNRNVGTVYKLANTHGIGHKEVHKGKELHVLTEADMLELDGHRKEYVVLQDGTVREVRK